MRRTIPFGRRPPPPAGFWDALAEHTTETADLARLAEAAEQRGLYRHAVELAAPAAEAGSNSATGLLGVLLAKAGHTARAEPLLRKASETDHIHASRHLAKLLIETGRRDEAEPLLHRAALTHSPRAMEDYADWLNESGQQSEAGSWRMMAYFSEHDPGATFNESPAAAWMRWGSWIAKGLHYHEPRLRPAAEAGDDSTMLNLAEVYHCADRDGDAQRWLRRAIEMGNTRARDKLAALLDGVEADSLRRFGIEPGGKTADPW